MLRLSHRRNPAFFSAAVVALFVAIGRGAEPSAPAAARSLPNPTVNASVTEWVVFVADAVNPQLNARSLFRDSLPPFAEDLRTARSADEKEKPVEPGPIGLIRFAAEGPIEKDIAVDVQIGYKSGRALGHWPRAKVRSSGLLWQDLRLAAEKGQPHVLPEGSWLASLRSGGLPLECGSTRESFLLYDVELPYQIAMQVTAGKEGKLSIAHGMEAPLHGLTFYKPAADKHWQTATLPALLAKAAGFPSAPTPAAAAPATTGSSRPAGVIRTVINGRVVAMAAGGAAVQATPAAATPAASTPAVAIKGTDFAFGPATETGADVLAPWRAKLADAGVSAADQEVVLKILARQALDPKRITAIYRMAPAELDRILPLEVVPQPKKVSRIALVVVTGIDPAIGDELAKLIEKLGDPAWKTREAATAEIKKLGLRAKSRLQEATKNADTEIAYRAEQLLASIGTDDDQHRAQYFPNQ